MLWAVFLTEGLLRQHVFTPSSLPKVLRDMSSSDPADEFAEIILTVESMCVSRCTLHND